MIELTRSLVRQFRAVVRQSLPPAAQRSVQGPIVVIEADGDGLHLRAHLGDVAIAYRRPNARSTETLLLPLSALQELEARTEETITLEAAGTDAVKARWHEGTVPRMRTFTTKAMNQPPAFPSQPAQLTPLPVHFLKALDEARKSTARDSVRYALNRLQLRGAKGEVVGTDGRQLLIQSGFAFPWQEEVLIPAIAAFSSRELTQADSVRIGKTATHVCIEVGPWTMFLLIDREGRYPRVDDVIPRPNRIATVCRLDSRDTAFLSRNLSGLVDPKDEDQCITLDLNGRVIVRGSAKEKEPGTELVLEHASVSGPPVRLATSRRYLQHALNLGLTEFQIVKPDMPVLAQRDGMRYVWMPLSAGKAEPAKETAQPIQPPVQECKPSSSPRHRERPKIRLHVPSSAPRPAPIPSPSTPERRPAPEMPRLLRVLGSLFAPRGWLWRRRNRQDQAT